MSQNPFDRAGSYLVALVGYAPKYGASGQHFELHNDTNEVFDVIGNDTLSKRYGVTNPTAK